MVSRTSFFLILPAKGTGRNHSEDPVKKARKDKITLNNSPLGGSLGKNKEQCGTKTNAVHYSKQNRNKVMIIDGS